MVVPDVAGWRIERLPSVPETHKFTVIPDWICEVLPPSTEGVDKEIKMPLYARYGVKYLWLIHPINEQLMAYKLTDNQWRTLGVFESGSVIRVEPFDLIEIDIDQLMG